jgi:hypothetical protein
MVMGLALWSLGMILVRSCSLTAIADGWSCRLGQPFQTVRERLPYPVLANDHQNRFARESLSSSGRMPWARKCAT